MALRMKETLEYFEVKDGIENVVKEKHHYLNKPNDERMNEDVFKEVCNELFLKRIQGVQKRLGAFWAQELVKKVVCEPRKVVIVVDTLYSFEYEQRWTYELI